MHATNAKKNMLFIFWIAWKKWTSRRPWLPHSWGRPSRSLKTNASNDGNSCKWNNAHWKRNMRNAWTKSSK